jgi:hypothetical protein
VYRVCDWHPEVGYFGNPSFSRIVIGFMVCGLVAGALSLVIFGSAPHPDSRDAMALAPAEALTETRLAQPATLSESGIPSAQETAEEGANTSQKTGSIKPACRESLGETRQGDCAPVRVVRMRPPRAANEQPLIAAVPIGHRDGPTVVPASPPLVSPAVPSRAIPREPETAPASTENTKARAADAIPVAAKPAHAALARAVISVKLQSQVHRTSRRRNTGNYADFNPSSHASSHSAHSSGSGSNRPLWNTFAYAHSW